MSDYPAYLAFREFDSAQAITEGWHMGDRSGDEVPYAIETLDDPEAFGVTESFPSDQDAYVHVVTQALGGSPYHQSALDFLREHSPRAYDWAVETHRARL